MTWDRYVNAKEAAALHDVSPATIRAWVRRGLLKPAGTVGLTHYYLLHDVDHAEMLARRRDTTGRSRQRLV